MESFIFGCKCILGPVLPLPVVVCYITSITGREGYAVKPVINLGKKCTKIYEFFSNLDASRSQKLEGAIYYWCQGLKSWSLPLLVGEVCTNSILTLSLFCTVL